MPYDTSLVGEVALPAPSLTATPPTLPLRWLLPLRSRRRTANCHICFPNKFGIALPKPYVWESLYMTGIKCIEQLAKFQVSLGTCRALLLGLPSGIFVCFGAHSSGIFGSGIGREREGEEKGERTYNYVYQFLLKFDAETVYITCISFC